jgi:hypothetical protein
MSDITSDLAARRQQAVSKHFMRLHAQDFAPCEANASIIANYVTANKLDWTLDDLEIAFEAVQSQLAPKAMSQAEREAEESAAQAKAELDAKKVADHEALASLPGYGMAIPQFTTPQELHAVPKDVFRKFYHSTHYGQVFRERINEVYRRSGKPFVGGKF